MTPYSNIYKRFEKQITDFDLDGLVLANKIEIELDILLNAIPQFTATTTDLSDRDDTLQQFNVTLTDTEELILALYMAVEWGKPYVNSQDLLEISFSTSEYNAFSDASKITAIRQLIEFSLKQASYLATKDSKKKIRGRLR